MPLDEVDKALLQQIGDALPDSAWVEVERTQDYVVSAAEVEVKGRKITLQRRQFLGEEELIKVNKHLFETSSSFAKRDAGAMGTPVAQIPLSMLYSPKTGIIDNLKKGNRDHLKWWLNRPENQPFRTQKGNL